jgi:phosphoadenosine phosphosulfate reductase
MTDAPPTGPRLDTRELRVAADPTPDLAAAGAAIIDRFSDPIDQARVALAWAHDTFDGNLVLASSMGDEVLVHLAGDVVPEIDVLFIDTGYHFPETLGTADAYDATRPIRLITVTPVLSVAEQDAAEGPDLFARDPDRCCALRKVEPLERGLARYPAWITGMRRADAPTRTDIEVIGWDARRGKVKVNPLAAWSDEDVAVYAEVHDVLLNPLRQIGYTSIGCAPCTNPTVPGQDPRAGRWSGRAKTECGLHL